MNFNFCSNYISDIVIKKAFINVFAFLSLIFFCAEKTPAQLDPTFGTNGVADTNISGLALASFILPDGKILVVSDYSTMPVKFSRFNSNGTLDTTYGTGGIIEPAMPFTNTSNGSIYSAIRQTDGKIILAGSDNEHTFITRFNENGTLDTNFGTNGVHRIEFGTWYDNIWDIVLLPDGKILGVGTAKSGGTDNHDIFLIRYNADGSLDTTFGNGTGYAKYRDSTAFVGFVEMKVLRQSDGRLLVFRKLSSDYEGSARISRFNADGTPDNTYPLIPLHGSFSKLTLQPDDKLLIAGSVDKTETLERKHKDISVRRYTISGSLDSSFGTNGITTFDMTNYFDDTAKELLVMPDGQILVSVMTSVPLNRSTFKGYKLSLARLSANGNTVNGKFLQTDMSAPIDGYHPLNKNSLLSIQPDGKILTVSNLGGSGDPRLLLTRALDVPIQTYRFHGTAYDFSYTPFDPWYNPNSVKVTSEPTLYRSSSQRWYSYGIPNGYPFFGLSDDIPVPSDYLGNFETELAVFRPSTGTWYIAKSQISAATNFIAVQWGLSGDIPVPADYDGDGKSDVAVFRPSSGIWYIRNSSDNSPRILQWGINGDKPVAGDFDGDGIYDVAVWRPSDGVWYILRSSDGQVSFINYGFNGDIPVQEDYDGDGVTDIAVWRPSTGIWYVLKSSDGNSLYFNWGISTDKPVPADYDGDFKTDFAIYRPSTGSWFIYRSSNNSYIVNYWGTATDTPVQSRN